MNPTPSFGEIEIDVERLMATRMLIQAGSGGGKSWALRRLVEQTAPHVQQFIIDPEGEFVSLREKFDHVICAAKGGDLLIQPYAAGKLARALWKSGCSAVLDISELNVPDRMVFLTNFFNTLIAAPREAWHPAMVVVDEAATFAPQGGGTIALQAMIDMATRGRKRGLSLVCAVQRISRLNKDVAAELGNRLIGRTTLDVDVARAADEMGMRKADATEKLRALRPGQFYAFGPALTPAPTLTTIGPVETTHHQAAGGARLPARSSVLEKIAKIEDVQQAVEEEDRTVADLKAEIVALKEGRVYPTPEAYEAACAALEGWKARARRAEAFAQTVMAAAADTFGPEVLVIPPEVTVTWDDVMRKSVGAPNGRIQVLDVSDTGIRAADLPHVKVDDLPRGPKMRHGPGMQAAQDYAEAHKGITKPQQRILDALAKLDVLGVPMPKKHVLAVFADASPKSSAYSNNLGALRSAGRIQYMNGGVCLTETGRALAFTPDVLSIQGEWLQVLTAPQQRIMTALLQIYPSSMSKEDLAARAGASAASSAFSNNLGWMRTLGILEYPAKGHVMATYLITRKKA